MPGRRVARHRSFDLAGPRAAVGQHRRVLSGAGKLPVAIIRRLTCEVADRCERAVPASWLWHGRHVKLVDGSTCSMPDTECNQSEYPQPTSQAAGVGFPLARFVVLLSLATAMISDLAIGPYSGKETGDTPCCASRSND